MLKIMVFYRIKLNEPILLFLGRVLIGLAIEKELSCLYRGEVISIRSIGPVNVKFIIS